MAYAEILVGEDGRIKMYLDGLPHHPKDAQRREHMVRENWSKTSSYDYSERTIKTSVEWDVLPDLNSWVLPLGNDVIVYRKTLSVCGEVKRIETWHYACGDTKTRIERDFNEHVAPVIMRDAPQVMPKRGKLHTYGIMDPRVDDFVWPENMKVETPPCIEIHRAYTKTMPIEAEIPPIGVKGKVMFMCQMRYSPTGDLVRANCRVMRRDEWVVQVSFRGKGGSRVTSVKKL